ncbi:fumarylacetoacetate hydrolase family protein [Nitratiruptor tergarcus]|uniref:2-keto-4-pentenoate hydratase/2-oxohepta-3-ene-1,7-dioic acid hydratase (Catechol pathway) n=1 Tax=Nitratiruptor tergarcus DSM 16512 TaxID=1069081 RepID=A0A1W1WR75_9BACT|nr:fumarylacetoacetate hydrolase family protein [Nitratiruptor tergarcus]SMC08797.1 2-keto-4-pentenoate hydratase/2-oxohepta-3-ene-1,7-dioic acid hydratase (catechol pathway) [Nitratiruptor tergarcus DSM 16512]
MKTIIFDNQAITPCKIVCIGRNYVEHIKELNNKIPDEPVYFIKPNSAIGDRLIARDGIHYEAEICFLIQNRQIAGVGFGFDLTLRDLQSKLKQKGLPWERAKAFKNSALFSKFVAIKDWHGVEVVLYKNGELVQKGGVELMIYKPDFLVKDIDTIFGLDDGDIIMSGTPKGVGSVKRGDIFVGEIYQNSRQLIRAIFKADA